MNHSEEPDGMGALLKETADGFSRLMGDHLKLARLEFFADAKNLGRGIATLVVVGFLLLLGYSLTCLGLAVLTSRWLGLSGALFLIGGLHGVGGVALLPFVLRRLQGAHLMRKTVFEARESVSTLMSLEEKNRPSSHHPEGG